jgi:hypothetical protein
VQDLHHDVVDEQAQQGPEREQEQVEEKAAN